MKSNGCRGFLPVLLGLFVFHLWAWPAGAVVVQPELAESGSVIVTAETAEVREGPGPSFEVLTVVERGEIFFKQGRTGAWYYIRINDDAFGWISGRAISRYQADGQSEGSPAPYIGPYDGRYEPYYPGFYGFPSFYWGPPYLSWEWYFYDREPHRDRSWDHDKDYYRDRYRDRPRGDNRHRPRPPLPLPGPRIRPPFPRK